MAWRPMLVAGCPVVRDHRETTACRLEEPAPEMAGLRSGVRCGVERLRILAQHVPQRQDVIHGDLLNRNVLVADSKIAAVFDWGCSLYGDHLYDIAWLTFCSPYTSGFDPEAVRDFAQQHYRGKSSAPVDFDLRIGCYELHIGLSAIAYQAFRGDRSAAVLLAAQTRAVLNRTGL